MSKFVIIILSIAIFICLILSAFFSSSESVYAKVSPYRLKKALEAGNKSAKLAYNIIENFSATLSTILIGNSLVNIAISSMATIIASEISPTKGPIYSAFIVTIVVLIFGEILPKTIAPKFSFFLAKVYAYFMKFFLVVFYPIVFVITKLINLLSRIWTSKKEMPTATDEELITLTEELEETGIIDEDDADLIISAIDLCDATAHEIMIPRVDVFALDIQDIEEKPDEVFNNSELFKHSRIPVYEDSIDNIIGILNSTVLMKKLISKETIDVRDILVEPLFVHKTKPVASVLKELKETKKHLAIVVDEFGGTMGIVTTEDIVEELVGDIWDEKDDVVPDYTKINDFEYEVDGDMNIYDFFELVEYDDRDFTSEYTTIGGWCTEVLEKFPQVGDHFTFANLTITITNADKMRVGKVDVVINQIEDE